MRRSTECVVLPDGNANNFPDTLAALQNVHVLVRCVGARKLLGAAPVVWG